MTQTADPSASLIGSQLETYQTLITMGFAQSESATVAQIFGSNVESAINCVLSGGAADLNPNVTPRQRSPAPLPKINSRGEEEWIQFRTTKISYTLMTGYIREQQHTDIVPTVIKDIIIQYFNLYFIKLNYNIGNEEKSECKYDEYSDGNIVCDSEAFTCPVYVVKHNTTLRNIAIELEQTYKYDYSRAQEIIGYINREQYSYFIHLWVDAALLKHIYPCENKRMNIDIRQINQYFECMEQKQDRYRWVEVPTDFEEVTICDLDKVFVGKDKHCQKMFELGIERFNTVTHQWPFRNQKMIPSPHEISAKLRPKVFSPVVNTYTPPVWGGSVGNMSTEAVASHSRSPTPIPSGLLPLPTIDKPMPIPPNDHSRVKKANKEKQYFDDIYGIAFGDSMPEPVTMEQWKQANNAPLTFPDIDIINTDVAHETEPISATQKMESMLFGNDKRGKMRPKSKHSKTKSVPNGDTDIFTNIKINNISLDNEHRNKTNVKSNKSRSNSAGDITNVKRKSTLPKCPKQKRSRSTRAQDYLMQIVSAGYGFDVPSIHNALVKTNFTSVEAAVAYLFNPQNTKPNTTKSVSVPENVTNDIMSQAIKGNTDKNDTQTFGQHLSPPLLANISIANRPSDAVSQQLHTLIAQWYPQKSGDFTAKLTRMFLQNHTETQILKYLSAPDTLKKKVDRYAAIKSKHNYKPKTIPETAMDKSERKQLWQSLAKYCNELMEETNKNGYAPTHRFAHPQTIIDNFIRVGLRPPNHPRGLEKFYDNFITYGSRYKYLSDQCEKCGKTKDKSHLKLGDTVCLIDSRTGRIKYIGPVTGNDEMIGVELDSRAPNATDGRYEGFKYFNAPDGRGVFVKRSAIVSVIPLVSGERTGATQLCSCFAPPAVPALPDMKWTKYLRIGDIIEAKDEQDKWYESVIRYITDSGEKRLLYLHYIGWSKKWDEIIDGYDCVRIAKRGTNTIAAHKPKKSLNTVTLQKAYPNFEICFKDSVKSSEFPNLYSFTCL